MWPPPDPNSAASFDAYGGDNPTTADDWQFDVELVPEYEPPAGPWWRQQAAIVAASSGVVLALVGIVVVVLVTGGQSEGIDRRIPERVAPTSVVLMMSSTTTTSTTSPPTPAPGPAPSSFPQSPRVLRPPPVGISPSGPATTSSTSTSSSVP